ncbi:MAG: DUF4433 domain-containing protein [Taibaiella sp.]|nr:DUF4433 domain-containing protein [Taibaiella sp.]
MVELPRKQIQSGIKQMDIEHFISNVISKSKLNSTFYHFTDSRNLPMIQQHGILSTGLLKSNGLFEGTVTGGNEWSLNADERFGMHKFVHLCFMNQHPMEWIAKKEKRIESTVFLQIDPKILRVPGVLITKEVSNKAGCSPMPPEKLDELDLEVVYERTEWTDVAVKSRLKLAKCYEVLVPDKIPVDYIRNLTNG